MTSLPAFYILAGIIIFAATCVLLVPNPIYAALALAGTMIGLGFMYFQLEAYFIAGVQLIVYAGAVMVLFVMVLMLFDLKKEIGGMNDKVVTALMKLLSGLVISCILFWTIKNSIYSDKAATPPMDPTAQVASVKSLATTLFTQHIFTFEVLGILLLIIAIGVVAISRTRGGTHARD